jgi:hypothetical protein
MLLEERYECRCGCGIKQMNTNVFKSRSPLVRCQSFAIITVELVRRIKKLNLTIYG